MKWGKEALTGLTLIVAGCSSCNSEQIIPPPAGVQVTMVEQDNKISVPQYDWEHVDHRTLDLNEERFLAPGYATQGHVELSGVRYDAVMDLADTNHDGNYDLIRITVDSMITVAPNIQVVGQSNKVRAIILDENHDGQADTIWVDELDEDEPGFDWTYDRRMQRPAGLSLPMDDVIENWLLFD